MTTQDTAVQGNAFKSYFDHQEMSWTSSNHLEDGFIDVKIGKDYAYQIKVSDANNNNRYLFIQIKGKEQEVAIVPKELPQGKEIEPNRDYLFMYDGAEIYIPKNTVYESNRFLIGFENNKLQIKADHVALRKAISISRVKAPDSVIEGHYLGIQFKNGEDRIHKQNHTRQSLCRENQKNRNIHNSARHHPADHKTIPTLRSALAFKF